MELDYSPSPDPTRAEVGSGDETNWTMDWTIMELTRLSQLHARVFYLRILGIIA